MSSVILLNALAALVSVVLLWATLRSGASDRARLVARSQRRR